MPKNMSVHKVGNGNPPPPDDPKGKKPAPVKKDKSK
jgi:hypothetical protein